MMVRLMEKNPDVASEIVPFGSTKKNRMELWEGIAAELNNIGFSIRSGSDWNKVRINNFDCIYGVYICRHIIIFVLICVLLRFGCTTS